MKIESDQKELVELFIKQEILIGTLYKFFANRYPEYRAFWTDMASEEHQHASWIKRLTERDPTDKFRFSQGELRSENLASSIESIESLISGFKINKACTISQAAGISLHIEKALWDKNVFQFFEGDSNEVRKILDTLHSEQKAHVKRIEKFAWRLQDQKTRDNDSL
jgi:rubrerythrin